MLHCCLSQHRSSIFLSIDSARLGAFLKPCRSDLLVALAHHEVRADPLSAGLFDPMYKLYVSAQSPTTFLKTNVEIENLLGHNQTKG